MPPTDERSPHRGVVGRILGGQVEPVLAPVLGVSFLHAVAISARASFMGLWALRALGSSQTALGLTFAGAAIASLVAGYAGGHLSDRIGRRPLILTASAAQALMVSLVCGTSQHRSFSIIEFWTISSPRRSKRRLPNGVRSVLRSRPFGPDVSDAGPVVFNSAGLVTVP